MQKLAYDNYHYCCYFRIITHSIFTSVLNKRPDLLALIFYFIHFLVVYLANYNSSLACYPQRCLQHSYFPILNAIRTKCVGKHQKLLHKHGYLIYILSCYAKTKSQGPALRALESMGSPTCSSKLGYKLSLVPPCGGWSQLTVGQPGMREDRQAMMAIFFLSNGQKGGPCQLHMGQNWKAMWLVRARFTHKAQAKLFCVVVEKAWPWELKIYVKICCATQVLGNSGHINIS